MAGVGTRMQRSVSTAASKTHARRLSHAGAVADAEDVIQEAFIRWMKADRDEVREPKRSCAAP